MARVFTILLTLVYAFSATGATVHLHYCCGTTPQKIVVQDSEHFDHADCPLCIKHHNSEKEGCCTADSCDYDTTTTDHKCQNVKVELKKTTEEHITSIDKNNLSKVYPLELLVFTIIDWVGPTIAEHQSIDIDHPTLSQSAVPLFIRHCTYRI